MTRSHRARPYLEDMADSIRRIRRYTEGLDLDGFLRNDVLQDAVIRRIEVLGEAVGRLPESRKARYPEIPWRDIKDMRARHAPTSAFAMASPSWAAKSAGSIADRYHDPCHSCRSKLCPVSSRALQVEYRQLCAVAQLELFQDHAQVIADCAFAEIQSLGDFSIAQPLCYELDDALFPFVDAELSKADSAALAQKLRQLRNDCIAEYALSHVHRI